MRKFIYPFLILFAVSGVAFAQTKNVAVVSFYINKQIDVSEFGAPAYLAVKKLTDDPNFNLAPLLTSFHNEFFNNYSKNLPFALLPEDQITRNEAYKAYVPVGIAGSGLLDANNFILPFNGYKIFLRLVGHDNENNMLKLFPQADGVMSVAINFKLIKVGFGGMGVVKVDAKATISLYNKAGEKVFIIEEDEKSKSVSPMVAGAPVMSPEKIIPMCESAMGELMTTLQKDLPKMAKKTDAKL